ncbi:hypothetical protein A3860_38010 [Niastella vici]|uniref:Uncharacterized protein n=1 Tax=Niastella vici TaxID=1703345 RepID=A0A1V9FLM6_9BACT|nr:hypothetical protein A3860_38010 [Niastella vici]
MDGNAERNIPVSELLELLEEMRNTLLNTSEIINLLLNHKYSYLNKISLAKSLTTSFISQNNY